MDQPFSLDCKMKSEIGGNGQAKLNSKLYVFSAHLRNTNVCLSSEMFYSM